MAETMETETVNSYVMRLRLLYSLYPETAFHSSSCSGHCDMVGATLRLCSLVRIRVQSTESGPSLESRTKETVNESYLSS